MHWELSLLLLAAAATTAATPPEPGAQAPARLQTQVPVQLDYLLYLPPEYEQREQWPLLLFLHGAGERGDDLERVKRHGPPRLVAEGRALPFIVASPQCPEGRWWQPVELLGLLDDLAERYRVDPDRVYVTGLSMGGFGTWALGAHAPDRFAALAPICGGGERLHAGRLAEIPIRAYHGDEDRVVPLRRSEEMVEAVNGQGGRAELIVYEGVGHDAWTQTYADGAFYDWLLAQRRGD